MHNLAILFVLIFASNTVLAETREYSFATNPKITIGEKCEGQEVIECDPNIDADFYIERDTDGTPVSVNRINSCQNKNITWTYNPNSLDDLEAPAFFLLFTPPGSYPGRPVKQPWSTEVIQGDGKENQKYTMKTRRPKDDEDECVEYLVIIPSKGVLDPVFIISK